MPMNKGQTKPRRPTVLKDRDGTTHSERENKNQPTPKHPGIPPPPPYLHKDEKVNWERFGDVLHNSYKILTKEHFAVFESLVCCFTQVQWLAAEVRRAKEDEGLTVEVTRFDKHGNGTTTYTQHPALVAQRAAVAELRQLCGLFGLSPADIGRVSVARGGDEGAEKNPEDEFGRGVA